MFFFGKKVGIKFIISLILDGNKNLNGLPIFTNILNNLNSFVFGKTVDKKSLVILSKKGL